MQRNAEDAEAAEGFAENDWGFLKKIRETA